jgi:hypothetical protein
MGPKVAYRRAYKVRTVGTGGYEVLVPKEVIERAARKRGLPVAEFLAKYRLVHLYDDFEKCDGIYKFEPAQPEVEEVEEPDVI